MPAAQFRAGASQGLPEGSGAAAQAPVTNGDAQQSAVTLLTDLLPRVSSGSLLGDIVGLIPSAVGGQLPSATVTGLDRGVSTMLSSGATRISPAAVIAAVAAQHTSTPTTTSSPAAH
jgi:hypothetical protein